MVLVLKCTSWSLITFKILPHFHFSFTVPSSITQITQDQNVTEGDNLTLTCNASGMPQPNVSWIKPGGQRQYGHMLEFTNINRSQAGEYKCEASNECGNATETATIDVQCKYMWKSSMVTSCFLFLSVTVYQFAFPSLYWWRDLFIRSFSISQGKRTTPWPLHYT